MTGSDTNSPRLTLSKRSTSHSRVIVHALLIIFGLILAFIVGGLVFGYQPNYNFYFLLSFALFVFVFGQSLYEFGGRRTILFLVISVGIGFGFEILGTTTGFLFGKYYYSSLLGDEVFGVPVVVPLAWFVITYITFSLALPKYAPSERSKKILNFSFPQTKIRAFALPIMVSAFGTVAWDFLIDPMFSNLDPPYWTWEITPSTPQLYGVPLSNFVGWFVVALFVLGAFVTVLKFGSKGRAKLLTKENTWDSRIAYLLLMIDGAVANKTLGQNLAVIIGVIAMSTFLLITFRSPGEKEDKSANDEENSEQMKN
jgi:uncharacterized membrane protein